MRAPATAGLVLVLALAGCTSLPQAPPADQPGDRPGAGDDPAQLQFGEPILLDEVRAGGEPVIAIARSGTILVSAHPGFTHYHTGAPTHLPLEVLVPFAGQSYLWRSADNGTTWDPVGLPNAPGGEGPRGLGFGVSDPDFTVTAGGRVYHTDLEALAAASVSWSDDDGVTWVQGNPGASGGPVDRQWLASVNETVYFTANYFTDHRLLRSEDGLVWEQLGDVPCGGDFVVAPDGTIYAGCGPGAAVSEDGGMTFEERAVPGHEPTGRALQEPAVDGAGNVWVAWEEEESSLWLAGSPDRGLTWPWIHDLTPQVRGALGTANATFVWPWASAGSAGRVAVSVYASPVALPSGDDSDLERPWHLVTVAVFGADSAAPARAGHVLKRDLHMGPICQGGTGCQVTSVQGDPGGDRRLGDFFESTIDFEGFLHVVYADTRTLPEDVISHPGYVRQTGGPRFVVDGFAPLQG